MKLEQMSARERALLARRLAAKAREEGRGAPRSADAPDGWPPPARIDGEPIVASLQQERMGFFHVLEPEAPTYNLPFAWRLRGELDAARLAGAFRALALRHDALRTRFATRESGSVVTLDASPDPLTVDTSTTDENDLSDAIFRETSRPFVLADEIPLRARLLRIAEDDHVLVMTVHHIAMDGASTATVLADLDRLYRGEELPPAGLPYAAYAAWQRRWLGTEAAAAHLAYWKRQLEAAPASLDLPRDRVGGVPGASRSGYVFFDLGEEQTAAVNALARSESASVFMVLLAAYAALLARTSNQDDIVIGTLHASRFRPELEAAVGPYVNVLPVRVRAELGATFLDLLRRVKQTSLEAYEHQEMPFERVLEALSLRRVAGQRPLFQVMMSLEQSESLPSTIAGLEAVREPVPVFLASADFMIRAFQTPTELRFLLEYDTALFDELTARRFADHFRELLASALAAPASRMERLAMLAADEEELVRSTWNATEHALEDPRCVHEAFAARAAETPDAIAVVFGDERVTYAELDRRANRAAHALLARGCHEGQVIAVCLERSVEMVVALYAVLKAGGAYAPLDPAHPPDRLALLVADLGTPFVIASTSTASVLAPIDVPLFRIDAIDASLPETPPPVAADPNRLAYLIYTSGSTGTPKGVPNVHAGLRNRIAWMQAAYRLGGDDVVLQKTPYTFDVSVWEFFWPLVSGARLVVARPEGHKDPRYLVETILAEGVTTVHFVPSMLVAFLEDADVGRCTTLRHVVCSGEALPRASVDRFYAKLGTARLHNLYGPTEASIDVSHWTCEPDDPRAEVPIGRPLWNTRLHVLDRAGNPCPVGVHGELHIGGVQVARGYWKRPHLTADRFVPDPFAPEPGARMYRTGDVARWLADGTLAYVGRADHQVKLRGYRIELGEIEALLRAQEGVADAVALVREDVPGDRRLVGYVVSAADAVDVDVVKGALARKLPEYMVPSVFVALPELPLTASGKLDRKRLPAPTHRASSTYVPPRSPLEESLCALWERVLGVERVGVDDDFFALGGHSLLVMRVVASVRDLLGRELRVNDLFVHPTVGRLAQHLAAGADAARPPAPRRTDVADGSVSSFIQDTMLFWEAARPRSSTWNIACWLDIVGVLDVPRLRAALHGLGERHAALRQTFDLRVAGWAGRLLPAEAIVLGEDRVASREALDARVQAEIEQPFAIAGDPLVRAVIVTAGELHRVLVTFHQLVHDATATSFLLEEWLELYDALGEARAPRLAPLPFRYVDYAVWERAWFTEGGGRAEVERARRRLDGARPVAIVDRPGPLRSARATGANFSLDADASQRFFDLCRSESLTPYMALSAIVGVLLARWSGHPDVVFIAPTNLRNLRPELERIVGRFLNNVPVRVDVGGDVTWRELFARGRSAILDAYATEQAPLTLLFDADVVYDHPLGRATLNWLGEAKPAVARDHGALTVTEGASVGRGARNQLYFVLRAAGGRIHGTIGGATDVLEASTIAARAEEMRALMTSLDPAQRPSLQRSPNDA